MRISIEKTDLQRAVTEGLLDAEQVDALWAGLSRRTPAAEPGNQSKLPFLLWYGGAGIVMLAMSWFMFQAWEFFSGTGLTVLSVVYAAIFTGMGTWLLRRPELKTPGGLLITLAVGMVPLAVFGIEQSAGMWSAAASAQRDMPPVRNLLMEGSLVLAALLAIRFVRFPFLGLPVAAGLWLASIDLLQLAYGVHSLSWNVVQQLTIGFGLLMLAASYVVDRKVKEDFAFWGYLFGTSAFWFGLGGLIFLDGGAVQRLLWFAVNLAMIFGSILLHRTVFLAYGVAGAIAYLGYLTFQVFAESPFFPPLSDDSGGGRHLARCGLSHAARTGAGADFKAHTGWHSRLAASTAQLSCRKGSGPPGRVHVH